MKLFKLVIVFLILFTGCKEDILKKVSSNISYEIEDIDINFIQNTQNLFGAILNGDFSKMMVLKINSDIKIIKNNDISLHLDKIKYSIYIDNKFIANGNINYHIDIPANGFKIQNIPIIIDLSKIDFSIDEMPKFDLKVKGEGFIKILNKFSIIIPFVIINKKIVVTDYSI